MAEFVRLLRVYCSHCKQRMNYQWDGRDISQKKKRCVYCGRSFGLKSQIL